MSRLCSQLWDIHWDNFLQERSIRLTLKVMRNLMKGHAIVYRSLKSKRPEVRIGIAKNVTLFDPLNRWSQLIGQYLGC